MSQGGWQMERRGRCWEYDGETGRQAQLQAGLFETSLVALSIPWVDGQSVGENSCWVGEKGVACQRRDAACHRLAIPTLVPSKYGILPSGSRVFPTIRIFFPCCRSPTSSTPPKDAYTHLSHFEEPPSPFSEKINNRFLVERMEEDDPDTPRRFEPESSTRRVISPNEKWFDAIRCLSMVSDSAKKCRITSDNSDNLRNFRC